MANHITKKQRTEIDDFAFNAIELNSEGDAINLEEVTQDVYNIFEVSMESARFAAAKAARRKRHPKYRCLWSGPGDDALPGLEGDQ